MRKIKFIAWDGKRMLEVVSILGEGGSFWEEYGISEKDVILRQFTGLKDKNGKEIYEVDIAKITTALFPETKLDTYTDISVMEFCEKTAQFKFNVKNSLLEGDEIPVISVEVIGNIYENPELVQL